jgi:putative aminopeptidase FrvX
VNVVGAFAVQEETGLRGATVTGQTVKPDAAIVFEGSPADDTVLEAYAVQTALKKGPMLRHFDARMITNPRFQRFALDTAGEKGIPVQEAVRTGGATNGGVLHLSGQAVPVIAISIPARYIHTHYSISSYSDFENAVRLAAAVIRGLDGQRIAGF